ncbi:MAG: hypothetical protein V7L27_01700 [Nostoc sp.]|uniref:hypothetical protein n=1 Tax=Nostoc sp. TaxID=1180 RepID=UPI002FFB4D0F
MGNPVLQLGNSANWDLFYSTTVQAVISSNGESYTPIPTITVPTLLESHIIATSVSCFSSKPTWYFGGFINQRINLGLTVGGLPDSDAVQKRRLYLNRLTLIIFPKLVDSYAVTFDVPKWFQDVTLTLFEYTGIERDSTDDLVNQIINVDLPRIESKIDALSHS